ncbi:MAG: hypothetical protein HYU86_04520 [Chloroflexi bacterium]|nr:hypothetical protein [Chloroflexota bacterium]
MMGMVGLLILGCVPAPVATKVPDEAASIMRVAVAKLQGAKGYRFTVTLRYYWQMEGKEQIWSFQGEGGVEGGRFRSVLRGPADTLYEVEISDHLVKARDARGELPNPSTTFGGPGFGAAPYTVVSYVRNFGDATSMGLLEGTETHRVGFRPRLAAVAALDADHGRDMQRVTQVKGEAWVDKAQGNLRREEVEVEFVSRAGNTERAVITIDFYNFIP